MPARRLSDEKRLAIEADLQSGMKQRAIANKHGIAIGTVSNVSRSFVKPQEGQSDPTDTRVLKLEAQLLACKDENNRCKQAYKASQRKNSIFEALVDEMKTIVKPIQLLPKAKRLSQKQKVIRESLVLHLSDEHADTVILPHQCGGLERFDFPIALRRAEQLVDTTVKFSQRTLNNYQFDTLVIIAHGDHTSGEIHKAVEHSHYRNQFRNSLAIGQMHSLMFRDLAPHFENINILYVPGNHGRRTPKKDYHGAWDNWDYLVAETARMYCSDLENVTFQIPDSFSAALDIEGYGFHISHGDDIRSWNNIPWYGIERKTRRLSGLSTIMKKRFHYYCFGHFHNIATQPVLDGETLINGSWTATDPYAFDGLAVYSEPSQLLHGVHKDRGISWRLHIKLKTSREHLGPNRYVINLAKEM